MLKNLRRFTLLEHDDGQSFLYDGKGEKYIKIEKDTFEQLNALLNKVVDSDKDSLKKK